jgi:hypothetical protein
MYNCRRWSSGHLSKPCVARACGVTNVKIIFSRKGFDKKNGGAASPIFPDGRICSIPVPINDRYSWNPRYKEIKFGRINLGNVVTDLTRGHAKRYTGESHGHIDPDLRAEALVRRNGWLPAYGPGDSAQTHLANNGVGVGDVFLFFGWFRRVEEVEGHWRFIRGEPDIHLLFGWLQVGTIFHEITNRGKLPLWAYSHPHVREDDDWREDESEYNDTLYVARKRLHLPGLGSHLPGGGVFRKYHKKLQLTEPGRGRRVWRVPRWMYPFPDKPPLSYHDDRRRWRKDGRECLLRTVDIGQEFVLDADHYPKAYQWLAGLFRAAA